MCWLEVEDSILIIQVSISNFFYFIFYKKFFIQWTDKRRERIVQVLCDIAATQWLS